MNRVRLRNRTEAFRRWYGQASSAVRLPLLSVTIITVWETIFRLSIISETAFPSLIAVLRVGATEPGTFLDALAVTAYEVAIGITIAWVCGISIGVLFGSSDYLHDVFKPIFSSLFAVPFILLYPIFLAWFGIGSTSKIIFGAVYGMFPIILNIMTGLGNTDESYLLLAKSMGASRLQTMFRIRLPMAIPSVVSALRIGTALVVVGVVFTQMIASTKGLGFVIQSNQTIYNTEHVYFAILLTILLVLVVDRALTAIESRVGSWQDTETQMMMA